MFTVAQQTPSRLTKTPQRSKPIRRSPPLNVTKATVFSWHDFLCPVAWLQQQQFVMPPSPALWQHLAILDQCIVQLVLQARSLGPVFVLCEDGATSVEALCGTFFPRCAHLFSSREMQQHIQLICAATPLSSIWHGQMLHMICKDRLPRSGAYSLTVFGGDGMRSGGLALAQHVKSVQAKVVRPHTSSVAQGLKGTLESLVHATKVLGSIVQHHDHVDMMLQPAPLFM
ncbi:unnamed protein product [Aphanomyces euteiches]